MSRNLIVLVLVLVVGSGVEAGPFGVFSRKTNSRPATTTNRPIVNAFLGSAQGVANHMASIGRIGHFGGNSGKEGVGMASSPQAAIRNCCYYGQYPVRDHGVAQGSNGMWYACCRY